MNNWAHKDMPKHFFLSFFIQCLRNKGIRTRKMEASWGRKSLEKSKKKVENTKGKLCHAAVQVGLGTEAYTSLNPVQLRKESRSVGPAPWLEVRWTRLFSKVLEQGGWAQAGRVVAEIYKEGCVMLLTNHSLVGRPVTGRISTYQRGEIQGLGSPRVGV